MYKRLIHPLKSQSFFLFGARGTGKSTWLRSQLDGRSTLFLDLLDEETFDRLLRSTKSIEAAAESGKFEWIAIDEVQRVPKILNLVHRMIEKRRQKFALTGSSSRKLKRGGANLLAGRAFVNSLFPLTARELGRDFALDSALAWGTLPKLSELTEDRERRAYLRSYVLTYVREEIQLEQVVRKLEPFREFLAVAAQMSGKIINHAAIGREVGTYASTIQNYFQILEDTYLGFYLPAFHRSVRKSQTESPKFYLFDNGVKRALEGTLDNGLTEGTGAYGEAFESFVIQEIHRLNHYCEKDFRLSFFATAHGAEVDLILSKGKKSVLIEIKSAKRIDEIEVRKLVRIRGDFGGEPEAYYLSRDPEERVQDGVRCMPWREFLDAFEKL